MRTLLQRVCRASVSVDGETVGAIDGGLLVLAGVKSGDTPDDCEWMAGKIAGLRIFPDGARRMNRSIEESGGAILLVSQFTLYGDVRKGRRPSFEQAARPEEAVPLLGALQRHLEARGLRVETGRFGAHMEVDLRNDGPVTLLLDSEVRRGPRAKMEVSRPEPAGARQRVVAERSERDAVPLVLASSSPRRSALLRELGLEFVVVAPDVDETVDVPPDAGTAAAVLAERKARAVAAVHTTGIVVAADTIVALDGRTYGKPADDEDAGRMLRELSNREHRVVTGVCAGCASPGRFETAVVETHVRFHALSEEEIRAYVATGEPRDKAGAYAIQGRGSLLVAGIRGDWTNVVGLPLGATVDLIARIAGREARSGT